MPDGVLVTVVDGMAAVEFLDPALRGPGVASLIEFGGAATVEKRTRPPRPVYIVPEGNARAVGLLDGDAEAAKPVPTAKRPPRKPARP